MPAKNLCRLKISTFFWLLIVSLLSCSKKEDEQNKEANPCSTFEKPSANSNSPVTVGGSVELTATGSGAGITFEWTGPDNFTSAQQNPVITNIAFDGGGLYYVRRSNGSCTSSTQSVLITVQPPCSIADNTGTFGTTDWHFYSLVTCGSGSNGRFALHASAANGELDVQFCTYIPPSKNMIFGVEPGSGPVFDSTDVQLVLHTGTDVLRGQNGSVYISADNGKVQAVFCGIQFQSAATPASLTGEAKIKCN